MRIKVGDTWYVAEPGQPIMVQLSEQDRDNIERMPYGTDRYACFHDDDAATTTINDRQEWMSVGYKPSPGVTEHA